MIKSRNLIGFIFPDHVLNDPDQYNDHKHNWRTYDPEDIDIIELRNEKDNWTD
jgi:hypothetical protein